MSDTKTSEAQVQTRADFIPGGNGFATKKDSTLCVLKIPVANLLKAINDPANYISEYTNKQGATVEQISVIVGHSSFQGKVPFYGSIMPNFVQGEVPDNVLEGTNMPEAN